MILDFFKSTNKRLRSQTLETIKVVVPKKNAHYHEIVEQDDGTHIIRVYKRKTGELVSTFVAKTKEKAQAKALEELNKHNSEVK